MNLTGGCCGRHPSGDCTDSEMASCGLMNLAVAAKVEGNTFKKVSMIDDKFKNREVEVLKNTFDAKSLIKFSLMNLMDCCGAEPSGNCTHSQMAKCPKKLMNLTEGCCGRHPSGDCTDSEMASCGLMVMVI